MQSRLDYLFHHRKSRPSGLALAGQLGIQRVKLRKGTGEALTPMTQARTLIRWGSAMDLPQGFQAEFTINTAKAISNSANKVLALTTMQQNGILCPTFSRTLSELPSGIPILGRTQHGSQGKDIVVYEDKTQIPQRNTHEFFSVFVPNSREYRIHVVRGEIIRVQGKYCDFPEQTGSGYIKNHSHGYRFRTPDKELNSDRKDAAINAVEALGLDFGAVDLIIGTDRKAYVLEVNTAPAMSPMTMGEYVQAFRKILEQNASKSSYKPLSASRTGREMDYAYVPTFYDRIR